MTKILLSAFIFLNTALQMQAHAQLVDQVKFFENDTILNVKLTTDINKLVRTSAKPEYLSATFSCSIADSPIREQVRIIPRGNMRRQICNVPPVKINFKNTTSPALSPLGSLKIVYGCSQNANADQWVLKEYVIYKIYNLLTEKSFHVRLLNFIYEDEKAKKKPLVQHAFLIEDEKALAKRNSCTKLKQDKLRAESADRNQMTLVALFEYMIGNTDWSVPGKHNTTLIQTEGDGTARPFVVPYDFDYSGLVDADYATPTEGIDIPNVRQRYYMGFERTPDELNDAIKIFNTQKENIYSLINNFELINEKNRKQMIAYLDDFYKSINNNKQVKYIFINGARKS